MSGIYSEDMVVGDTREFGSHTVEEEEMIEFAKEYDPHPFHTGEETDKESIFDGLVASGLYMSSVTQRMLIEHLFRDSHVMGALGMDNLRWHHPVRAGDTLSVETEVVETNPINDDRDIVKIEITTSNQDDTEVMSFVFQTIFKRKDEL
ncbi:MaoC/PaaZ C-terminal domain-containing protein [Haladaptatus sp. DYF46]|uniref:MaoC/PaaZ C-terminal domain-containing protein n=1 Tax=Haladaptatus sp. DYF46 TaxID=2886041 RepID=UPI001E3C1B3A|nr:MaoC/PaaZ C-terminal domain-containing protein [Haladaptatus sp. DYF46]